MNGKKARKFRELAGGYDEINQPEYKDSVVKKGKTRRFNKNHHKIFYNKLKKKHLITPKNKKTFS